MKNQTPPKPTLADTLNHPDHQWMAIFSDRRTFLLRGSFLMTNAALHNLKTVHDEAAQRDPNQPLPVDEEATNLYFSERRN